MSSIDRELFENGMTRFYAKVYEVHGEFLSEFNVSLRA